MALAIAAAWLASPSRVVAQRSPSAHGGVRDPASPRDSVTRSVEGRVITPVDSGVRGVGDAWVTLHRIGRDRAGPLDSVRSAPDGGYRFRWRTAQDDEATYIVSAMHAGIAHFSEPLRPGDVRGDDAEVVVFDTTSAPVGIRVQGRHLAISASERGERQILEVYELSNDGRTTRIAPDSAHPVWAAVLPAGATHADLGAGAAAVRDGRVIVLAPFSPGMRQLSYRYRLPERAFPLAVPLLGGAEVLEVLVEEPQARLSGAGLREMERTTLEGRTFRRFLARDVDSSAVVRVEMPSRAFGERRLVIGAVAGALALAMAGSLAWLLAGRRRAG
jgi:hypothetical protein